MNDETVKIKNGENFTKSLKSGINSVFSGKDKTYYILEYKVSSEKYKAGEKQEIIVDYIELGRDVKCQVQFGDNFPTVSRHHAAITKDGNDWVLRNLSESNPTLINGMPIEKQWYLQNGDEIQLSYEGPKLGFLIPQNPLIKSLSLTHRLNLFGKQALKPYKKAIAILSSVLFLALCAIGFVLYKNNKSINDINKSTKYFASDVQNKIDSITKSNLSRDSIVKNLQNGLEKFKNAPISNKSIPTGGNTGTDVPKDITLKQFFPNVYFIYIDKVDLMFQDKKVTRNDIHWSGTGFLLNNKRFVTARHNIEPWCYNLLTDLDSVLRYYLTNGGSILAHFIIISPYNTKIFLTSNDFTIDRTTDKIISNDDNGNTINLIKAYLNDKNDWTYAILTNTGNIEFDNKLSANLSIGSELYVLGYPEGFKYRLPKGTTPIYGSCNVAKDGLTDGMISVKNYNFINGNTGGPVFVKTKEGKYVVVGIATSNGNKENSNLVPISAIK